MPRYIYPGPYARTPIETNVPPAWSPPGPLGVVTSPESPPPGARFITTELDLAWPGGRNALGVPLRQVVRNYTPQQEPLVRYAGIKDRNMWGSHMPEPQPVAFMGDLPADITIYRGSRSLANEVDLDEDDDLSDLDDEGLMEDLRALEGRRGSSNARGSRAVRHAVLKEVLGVTQDDIDFVESYGADEQPAAEGEAEAKKRPFERTRTFFTDKVPQAVADFRDQAKRAERRSVRQANRAAALRKLSEDMAVRSEASMVLASKQLDAQQARSAREAEERERLDAQRAELEAQRASPPSPGIVESASSAVESATSAVKGLSTPVKVGIGVAALAAIGATVYFATRRT
jgi:hypothetical protein